MILNFTLVYTFDEPDLSVSSSQTGEGGKIDLEEGE